MRKILFLVLTVAALHPLVSQTVKPVNGGAFEAERLAVLPFVNTTDVEQWDTLGRAMAETIELTLRLSGQFDVATLPEATVINPYAPDGPLRLRDLSTESRLDAAIIGRISDLENGRVELQAAAYSAATGEIIGAETREAFGSFDILDAADELVVIASSAFLGYEVNFGGLILRPSRTDVPFRVYIDGINVGQNIPSVPQVLTGRRTVEVAVVTSRGEQYVYAADLLIRPGEATEIVFGLPSITNTEQRQIRASHQLATELLGRPEQYLLAFEALSESRQLLRESTSETLEPLQERQQLLETLWQLEEEMYRLRPDLYGAGGAYVPGAPLEMMSGSASIATERDRFIDSDGVQQRILRNGAAQYYILHILWVGALGRGELERAEQILADMELVAEHYGLDSETTWRPDRTAWRLAQEESQSYTRRRRRPWPYIGLAAGLGGIGYGGYSIATDQVGVAIEEGDEYYDAYEIATNVLAAESLRQKAEDRYDEAEFKELVQWSSIAAGGVVAILSTWRIISNRRADRTFLRDWAVENYGQEIAVAERLFSRNFIPEGESMTDPITESDEEGSTRILVLGPPGEVVHADGQPRVFPFLTDVPTGEMLETGRAPIVDADRTRIYSEAFSITVLR